jgi:alpha-mannosidase
LDLKTDANFVVTGLKAAEEGKGSIVRGYDSAGRGGHLEVRSAKGIKSADEVNILEEPRIENTLKVSGDSAAIEVKPWGVASLKWV